MYPNTHTYFPRPGGNNPFQILYRHHAAPTCIGAPALAQTLALRDHSNHRRATLLRHAFRCLALAARGISRRGYCAISEAYARRLCRDIPRLCTRLAFLISWSCLCVHYERSTTTSKISNNSHGAVRPGTYKSKRSCGNSVRFASSIDRISTL